MGARKLLYNFVPFLPNDYFLACPVHTGLPNRHGASNEYRYGFNGMEKDDEITGIEGSHLDFGARIYDSRVERWFAMDPLVRKFPSESPYSYVMNSLLMLIDPDGKSPKPPKKLYRYSTNNKKSSDTQSFKNAALKMQKIDINKNGGSDDGIEKLKAVNNGQDIVTYINSQANNSIGSIDYFGHGGFSGAYFKNVKTENGTSKMGFYKDPKSQADDLKEVDAHPIQKSANINDINPNKFRNNARIELHGCAMAGEALDRNENDNLAIEISKKLYGAGKKNAVVIAHVGQAGPYYPEWEGSTKYDDYRQNTRNVYWAGNLVYQTDKKGHIEQSTIDNAIKNWKITKTTTKDFQSSNGSQCTECDSGGG